MILPSQFVVYDYTEIFERFYLINLLILYDYISHDFFNSLSMIHHVVLFLKHLEKIYLI